MIEIIWAVIGTILLNLIVFSALYISDHSQNNEYFNADEAVIIKRFNKICWFKDKHKGVMAYCYVTQVYAVIQFLVLLVISAVYILYALISNSIDSKLAAIGGFCYTLGNCAIVIVLSMAVYVKYKHIREKAEQQKEERRLKRQQKRKEELKQKAL